MADDTRDLLGAWAVDAVDDLERRTVERAIAQDPELAREARALRDSVGRLAEAEASPPPEELRARVLDEVARTPQRTHSDPAARTRRSRHSGDGHTGHLWWRRLAVAAVLVLAVAIPSGIAWQEQQRAERLQAQVEMLVDSLGSPGATVVQEPVEGGGTAAVVHSESGSVVVAAGLPPIPDHDYQLWMIDDAAPVSAGVLQPQHGRITAQVQDVPDGASMAITVEPPGGSDQPTTEPIVVLPSP